MKSPKVTHATHHFQWQKIQYVYVGWEGLKKHYGEKTFEKIPVHCNLRIHIFVKPIVTFLGPLFRLGINMGRVWLTQLFCPGALPGLLLGGFICYPLKAPPSWLLPCPYMVMWSVPAPIHVVTWPITDLPHRQPLNLPKDSLHCASPVTVDCWVWTLTCSVYVDENVKTRNLHHPPTHLIHTPIVPTLYSKWFRSDCRSGGWNHKHTCYMT